MKPRNPVIILTAIVIIIVAIFVSKYVARKVAFEQLHVGMSEQQVLSLYGKPDRIEKPGESTPAWDQEPLKGNYEPVAIEWTYWSPLPLPEGWLVGFDAHGTLVKRVNLASY